MFDSVIEYRDNYSKTWWSLWHHYGDEPDINDACCVTDFLYTNNNSVTGQREISGTKYVQIMVSLKNLSNFWGTLEMPLILRN